MGDVIQFKKQNQQLVRDYCQKENGECWCKPCSRKWDAKIAWLARIGAILIIIGLSSLVFK